MPWRARLSSQPDAVTSSIKRACNAGSTGDEKSSTICLRNKNIYLGFPNNFRHHDCPTCRSPATPASIIKLFLEVDDSEERSTIEDILKANEVLAKKNAQSKNQTSKLQCMLASMETELKIATADKKSLERQNMDDKMTIAGLTYSDRDATILIEKLKKEVNSLKAQLESDEKFWQNFENDIDQLYVGPGSANKATEPTQILPEFISSNLLKRTAPGNSEDRLRGSVTHHPITNSAFSKVQRLENFNPLLVCSSCRSGESNFYFCNCE